MIILAAAIILSLSSSGIFGKANQAKTDTEHATLLEAANVIKSEYELLVSSGELDPSKKTLDAYVREKLKAQGFTESQLERLSILSDGIIQIIPVIPEGFVMSPYVGEQKVEEGLVIYELKDNEKAIPNTETQLTSKTTRNQFVWVPIENPAEMFEKVDGNYRGKLYHYINATVGEDGTINVPRRDTAKNAEPEELKEYTWDGTTTPGDNSVQDKILDYKYDNLTEQFTAEYNAMAKSIETYGGFYVGRYETSWNGTKVESIADEQGMTTKTDLGSDWFTINGQGNNATWYGLYKKQKELYNAESDDVVSGMIYGAQWDAIMRWLKGVKNPNGNYYILDSTGMGWYYPDTGENAKKTGEDKIDVNGNVLNCVKNIYDLAGNYYEFTQEANIEYDKGTSAPEVGRVHRGGSFGESRGTRFSASYRSDGITVTSDKDRIGTRLQLYIK